MRAQLFILRGSRSRGSIGTADSFQGRQPITDLQVSLFYRGKPRAKRLDVFAIGQFWIQLKRLLQLGLGSLVPAKGGEDDGGVEVQFVEESE